LVLQSGDPRFVPREGYLAHDGIKCLRREYGIRFRAGADAAGGGDDAHPDVRC